MPYVYTPLKEFKIWCQKVLPLVYDDSLSYYEVLCKLVKYLNTLIENVDAMHDIIDPYSKEFEALQKDIEDLQAELDAVKNGEYAGLYVDAMAKWIDDNIQKLVGKIVKYVFFGLSMDGHFVAYIPETWDFIEFDSVVDPSEELYGHLILRW